MHVLEHSDVEAKVNVIIFRTQKPFQEENGFLLDTLEFKEEYLDPLDPNIESSHTSMNMSTRSK